MHWEKGYIHTYKGAKGGIEAAMPPDQVSLMDLCVCIDDMNFFALTVHDANMNDAIGGKIGGILLNLYEDYNNIFREYLRQTTIMDLLEMSQE